MTCTISRTHALTRKAHLATTPAAGAVAPAAAAAVSTPSHKRSQLPSKLVSSIYAPNTPHRFTHVSRPLDLNTRNASSIHAPNTSFRFTHLTRASSTHDIKLDAPSLTSPPSLFLPSKRDRHTLVVATAFRHTHLAPPRFPHELRSKIVYRQRAKLDYPRPLPPRNFKFCTHARKNVLTRRVEATRASSTVSSRFDLTPQARQLDI